MGFYGRMEGVLCGKPDHKKPMAFRGLDWCCGEHGVLVRNQTGIPDDNIISCVKYMELTRRESCPEQDIGRKHYHKQAGDRAVETFTASTGIHVTELLGITRSWVYVDVPVNVHVTNNHLQTGHNP